VSCELWLIGQQDCKSIVVPLQIMFDAAQEL
jgi:hypothetical protein